MTTLPNDSGAANESERLLAEALALDREGKLRQTRVADLELRLQRAMADEQRRVDELLASVKAPPAPATPARRMPRGMQAIALLALTYPLVGSLLELALGGGFLFAFRAVYWAAAPWLFCAAWALWISLLFRAEVRERVRLQHRSWIRRWLVLPLAFGGIAAMSVAATPGWAALLGWLVGGPASQIEAEVAAVEPLRKHAKGCDQSVELRVHDDVARLCLDGRMAPPEPVVGERLVLVGRTWWSGMFVEQIRRP
jgi:hypothetical protein